MPDDPLAGYLYRCEQIDIRDAEAQRRKEITPSSLERDLFEVQEGKGPVDVGSMTFSMRGLVAIAINLYSGNEGRIDTLFESGSDLAKRVSKYDPLRDQRYDNLGQLVTMLVAKNTALTDSLQRRALELAEQSSELDLKGAERVEDLAKLRAYPDKLDSGRAAFIFHSIELINAAWEKVSEYDSPLNKRYSKLNWDECNKAIPLFSVLYTFLSEYMNGKPRRFRDILSDLSSQNEVTSHFHGLKKGSTDVLLKMLYYIKDPLPEYGRVLRVMSFIGNGSSQSPDPKDRFYSEFTYAIGCYVIGALKEQNVDKALVYVKDSQYRSLIESVVKAKK